MRKRKRSHLPWLGKNALQTKNDRDRNGSRTSGVRSMNTDTSWSQMDECLVILSEECEVIQRVLKTMRFPEDDEKNRTRFKELGDLQCMIDLTCKHLDIDQEDVVGKQYETRNSKRGVIL